MTLQAFLQISLEFLIIYIIFLRYTYKLMEASYLFSKKMNTNHVYIQLGNKIEKWSLKEIKKCGIDPFRIWETRFSSKASNFLTIFL